MVSDTYSVGVVLPSNNTILTSEFDRVVPPRISVKTQPMVVTDGDAQGLLAMSSTADRAVNDLVEAEVNVLLYACLSTSLARGSGWDRGFTEGVEKRTGLRCFTAASATIQAVHALGAKQIGLVTPYPPAIDRLVPSYFAEFGLDVIAKTSLNIANVNEVGSCDPSEVARMAHGLIGEFDALVVLATDLRTLEVIEEIERTLGVPVVTTNQALAWRALDELQVHDVITSYGSLLAAMPKARWA